MPVIEVNQSFGGHSRGDRLRVSDVVARELESRGVARVVSIVAKAAAPKPAPKPHGRKKAAPEEE